MITAATSVLRHLVVLLSLAYLVATVIFQFRPLSTRLLALDPFGILPRWKFFLPQSKRLDICLHLRGGSGDEPLGDWIPIGLFPRRGIISRVWFPEQHHGAILWISAQQVALKAIRGASLAGYDSVAYQTLLRHVRQVSATYRFDAFEFALIRETAASDGERMVFLSERHIR